MHALQYLSFQHITTISLVRLRQKVRSVIVIRGAQ